MIFIPGRGCHVIVIVVKEMLMAFSSVTGPGTSVNGNK